MFGQMIQNILVYVIMINVLQGLVTSQGFREIFRFVGGMILIVLCVSPILSRISDTDQIGKYRTQIIIIDLNICRDLTITGKCNLRFFRKTVL